MTSGSITSWQIDGEKVETVADFIFLGSKINADGDCRHEIKRQLILGRKDDKPSQHIKKQRHHFANKGLSSQSYGFSSSHVQMWELDHKEGWALKNWCFWNVLEKTLENSLDCTEIKPVNSKGNQPWIFIGRTDAEAEAPIFWLPEAKSRLIGKDPDGGKDWGQKQKGVKENEIVGWFHWLSEHEFAQIPGDSEGQGSLACCSPWSYKVLDTTEWLNINNNCTFGGNVNWYNHCGE